MMTLACNTQVMCLIHQESTTLVYDDASLQYTGDVSDTPRDPLHWSMMTLACNTQVMCLIHQESTTLVYDDASLQHTGDVSDSPRIHYTGL